VNRSLRDGRGVIVVACLLVLASVLVALPRGSGTAQGSREPTTARPAVIGVDGGSHWWEPRIERRQRALGARYVRREFAGDLDHDVRFAQVRRTGQRTLCLMGGGERWRRDPDAYVRYVTNFARRYAKQCVAFEIVNEPYARADGAQALYARTYRRVVRAARRVAPSARFLISMEVGGEDGGPRGEDRWVDALYDAVPDLNAYVDGVAVHLYGDDPVSCDADKRWCFRRIDRFRERLSEHGAADKPFWITELGVPTGRCYECVGEKRQAEWIGGYLEAVRARTDVAAVFLYQLSDLRTGDWSSKEFNFGLLRSDGRRKPAYGVVRAAVSR